jgi:WD40 repeat protein
LPVLAGECYTYKNKIFQGVRPIMENRPSENRFGRFGWLWILYVVLSVQISLALEYGNGLIRWGIYALIAIPLLMVGAFFFQKALKEDNENNISFKPFRNIFLPWPRSAILLAAFVLVEFLVMLPLFAFTFYPCSDFDLIRRMNGCVEHIPHQGLVIDIAFSKDGKTFATAEFEGNVRVWSYPDVNLLNNLGNGWPFGTKLSISSNGEMIAICSYGGDTSIIEAKTGKILHTLVSDNEHGCEIAFAPDDNLIYIVSESEMQIWDVSTGKLSKTIVQENLGYFDITEDGSLLATGSRGGIINIWRTSDSSTPIATMQHPYLQSLAFSSDGMYLFTLGLDIESIEDDSKLDTSIINVWNIKTGEVERTVTLQGIRADHISGSKSGIMFVVGESLCFRNNRSFLEEPCAYLWKNVDDETPVGINIPDGMQSIMFSPKDEKVFIGSYENLYIWTIP